MNEPTSEHDDVDSDGCPADYRDWEEWWDSLTPEERAAEIRLMDKYGGDE